MKRQGNLMATIAEPDNLRRAFWKAAKSKRGKADCRAFQEQLDSRLADLRSELLEGRVSVGEYHTFLIKDPKERMICAASFRERALHHALMNVCAPALERAAIFDSYACREGKGQQAAVLRAASHARHHGWFLKMDIRKYFDSIDHAILLRLLERKFKDPSVMKLFRRILDSYETSPGCGLPIGNLTSQHFANHYLAPVDRLITEQLGGSTYVRYMDDFVVWGDSRAGMRETWRRVEEFLTTELRLELKANVSLNRTSHGMDFLGCRVFPHEVRLARRSKLRFQRKFRAHELERVEGRWTDLESQQRMTALVAFTLPWRSRNFRSHVVRRFGVAANRLEPRDPRRQLEQQCQQLPVGEPQQQQSGQRQQQQRLPGCSGPSSTRASADAPADPAAILASWQLAMRRTHAHNGSVSVADQDDANAPSHSPPCPSPESPESKTPAY